MAFGWYLTKMPHHFNFFFSCSKMLYLMKSSNQPVSLAISLLAEASFSWYLAGKNTREQVSASSITWDQVLFLFLFFGLLLWLEREKNNAWYIHLTSRQPPRNLHNLTSPWPVMLLANKRLPYRNQILARIMSLLKSILGKRKFLSTSMFRWRFDS